VTELFAVYAVKIVGERKVTFNHEGFCLLGKGVSWAASNLSASRTAYSPPPLSRMQYR
jgi:hypothetical protein